MGGFGPQSELSYFITISIWICGRLVLLGMLGGCLPPYLISGSESYTVLPAYNLFKVAMIASLIWVILSFIFTYCIRKADNGFRGRYFTFEFIVDIGLAACYFGGIGGLSEPDREETGSAGYALLISIGALHVFVALGMLIRSIAYGAWSGPLWPTCGCGAFGEKPRPASQHSSENLETTEISTRTEDLEQGLGLAPRYRSSQEDVVVAYPAPIHQMFTAGGPARRNTVTGSEALPKYDQAVENEPPPPYVRSPRESSESTRSIELPDR